MPELAGVKHSLLLHHSVLSVSMICKECFKVVDLHLTGDELFFTGLRNLIEYWNPTTQK
jgi:hypothetical protein